MDLTEGSIDRSRTFIIKQKGYYRLGLPVIGAKTVLLEPGTYTIGYLADLIEEQHGNQSSD